MQREINDSQKSCRFCGVAIDPAVAELVASRQELVNQSCSDASYVRTAAVALYVLIVGSLILGFFFWAFLATFGVAIVLLIRWQIRYSNIITDDPDYARAKKTRTSAFVLTIFAMPALIVVHVAFAFLIRGIPSN